MQSGKLWLCFFLLVSSSLCAQIPQVVSTQPYPGTISVAVDASAAQTKLFHAKLSIPVKPGPLVLFYPKWISGEHGPTGPVVDLTCLSCFVTGHPISGRRD